MQILLPENFRQTKDGETAEKIVKSCVHCGFCTATCPTYQITADELDSPRGRIYLIKQMLEENQVSNITLKHLDRCLTCRACETICPSDVQFGALLDIGRKIVEKKVKRNLVEKFARWIISEIIPYPKRLAFFVTTGQLLKPLLPNSIKRKIPRKQKIQKNIIIRKKHQRQMIVMKGCAQSVVTPNTNQAAQSVLSQIGIDLIEPKNQVCCGSIKQHLNQDPTQFIKKNIKAWWEHIENGAEALVVTASGCAVFVKEYGDILKNEPEYASKAAKIAEITKDIAEVINQEKNEFRTKNNLKIAFHAPCTLQHGQKINGVVENILQKAGFKLANVKDAHLCCGSAGTYSILQPKMANELLQNKIKQLQAEKPQIIATANIGCQLHLQTQTEIPVKHWIELLDEQNINVNKI